jgi:hypothetical protein
VFESVVLAAKLALRRELEELTKTPYGMGVNAYLARWNQWNSENDTVKHIPDMDAALVFVQAIKPLYREEASIRASDLRKEGTAGTEPCLNQEILDWQYFFTVEGERTFKAKSSASRVMHAWKR